MDPSHLKIPVTTQRRRLDEAIIAVQLMFDDSKCEFDITGAEPFVMLPRKKHDIFFKPISWSESSCYSGKIMFCVVENSPLDFSGRRNENVLHI
jgi:hypothetical protein